jgi:hypothetical protein
VFEKLKVAMCGTPILVVLNFKKAFIVECDASHHGIGVVFMVFFISELKYT